MAKAMLQRSDTWVVGISRRTGFEHPRYQPCTLDLLDIDAVTRSLSDLFPTLSTTQSLTLINNVGMLGEIRYVGELPNTHFQTVFDLDVVAPATLMNAFLRAYEKLTALLYRAPSSAA